MPDRSEIRLLIIDDDREFADVLCMHLIAAGYAVEVAEDAIEGGKAVLARPPSLILCDVGMPYLDGLELMSLLQTDAESASIPVIFVSGRSDSTTMARAVDLGAADFLTKPITRDQLLQSVEACLRAGGRSATPPDYRFTPVV